MLKNTSLVFYHEVQESSARAKMAAGIEYKYVRVSRYFCHLPDRLLCLGALFPMGGKKAQYLKQTGGREAASLPASEEKFFMITIQNIRKSFGHHEILKDVSLRIEKRGNDRHHRPSGRERPPCFGASTFWKQRITETLTVDKASIEL
jgi:hypothetical protein